ncbi:MAG: Mth938-like domain-containing protein [Candidatus Puniceispirillaceae bacterium]
MNDPKSPDAMSAVIDVRAFSNKSNLKLINGYGDNSFRVSGQIHSGSIILSPRRTLSWYPPENSNDLTVEHIVPLLGKMPPPLFILGVGGAPTAPMNDLAGSLKGLGIALELMSTAAACRTWNVLMSEGRDAAAGVYAIA